MAKSKATRRDALTGALTRDDFAASLEEHVAAARQSGLPLSLCIIDLDHFKSINDAFGHARGDEVLVETALRLHADLRGTDLLFRYGGDEFVLLLPDTEEPHATALAGRLLDRVRAHPVPGASPLTVSLSIGVAALDPLDPSADSLFARADARTYVAKRLGRGRVATGAEAQSVGHLHLDADSRLLEREVALEQIHAFLDAAPGAGRGMLSIVGSSGMGRSRLLREAARAARLRGYVAIELQGRAALRSRLYGALLDLEEGRAAAKGAADPPAIADALCAWAAGTGGRGLLIAADDAAELDAGTVAVLGALLRPSAALPVALALVGESFASTRFAFGVPLSVSLPLAAVSAETTRLWLRGALTAEPPVALVTWLQEQAGGVFGRMRTLLQHLVDSGCLAAEGRGWALLTLPELVPAPPMRPRLPQIADSFIGRVAEIQQLKDLLEESSLVTVIGPGGVGKSRLAAQVAAEIEARYPGGVACASLAHLHEATDVAHALLAALDLGAKADEARDTLLAHVAGRRLLLVLDGAEEMAEPTMFADLCAQPGVTLLVTARRPLGLPGEVSVRLGPLSLPGEGPALDGAEAALLFMQRAQTRAPDWVPMPEEHAAIGEICRAVGGLPLGLELAAAWLPALGIHELAAMLTGGTNRPGIQEVLPAVAAGLDAFWRELGEGEQQVLRGLAVFVGGFTAEASATVAGASRFLLAALVDRAFLRREGRGRYTLHELLRQYAEDHAGERTAEWTAFRARHMDYYLAVAERAAEGLHSAEQRERLNELVAERDNLRAALHWATESDQGTVDGLRLAVALRRYWQLRGALAEGRAWLARGLLYTEAPEALRAAALSGAGVLAHFAGDPAEAARLLEESVTLYRQIADRQGLAHALNNLGMVRYAQADEAAALACYGEGLALLEHLDDARALAATLSNMGLVAWKRGDLDRAATLFTRCLAIERGRGDVAGTADSLDNLGALHGLQGDGARAAALFEEALATHRELGNRQGAARSLANLAELALHAGDHAGAARRYRESLRLCREIGSARGVVARIEGLALASLAGGDTAGAATLLGAAGRWRGIIGVPLTGEDRRAHDQAVALLRQTLGEPGYTAALEAGAALREEEAVALALHAQAETNHQL